MDLGFWALLNRGGPPLKGNGAALSAPFLAEGQKSSFSATPSGVAHPLEGVRGVFTQSSCTSRHPVREYGWRKVNKSGYFSSRPEMGVSPHQGHHTVTPSDGDPEERGGRHWPLFNVAETQDH